MIADKKRPRWRRFQAGQYSPDAPNLPRRVIRFNKHLAVLVLWWLRRAEHRQMLRRMFIRIFGGGR